MKDFNYCLEQIKNIKNRIEIDFRDNIINDNMLDGVYQLLKNNNEINELCLWFPSNNLTSVGVKILLDSIKNMRNLRDLTINLEWNFAIDDTILVPMLDILKKLINLDMLILKISKNNSILEESEIIFKNSISKISNLKKCLYDNTDIITI